MRFRILGPLDVANGAGSISLDAPKPRALLGVLLLHPNEAVSKERLIDELWGERPPATAAKVLQTYVSHLRRVVGADRIATRRPGYLLRVDDDALDATQFRRLSAEGRRLAGGGDDERAGACFREALALWRGPALADVVFESLARNDVDRLEEERLGVVMDLIDSELALGRHDEVVQELDSLVREHPLRERLRAQLMLVLYRAGRQADALEVYQEGRRILARELGIDPGPQLKELEAKILRQDPSLLASTRPPAAGVEFDPPAAPAAPAAPPVVRAERKVITALFADLVDFTATAERLDPEDVQALQDPYWRHVRAEIERRGGTVEKFIGDAVVALFGAPTAHEDDPERAVRAAIAIREWAREQEATQVRVGITTGEALVRLGAQPLAGEGMASGDVVNTASRLQTAATANAILVDEATYRATRDAIEYGEAEAVTLKGKGEPVHAWQALHAQSRFGADLVRHAATPLVGRDRELDLLRDALARVRAERTPQLVTLVGVPGIGKSRLVFELMQAISDDSSGTVTWLQGRTLPYGDGVSFWALGEIVKAHAGILETDTVVDAQSKLSRAVRTLCSETPDAAWVERHLRPLVGLGSEFDISSDRETERFAPWRRFVEALAELRPTVVVFEDLHWADEGLLDFLDNLVEWVRDVPLLVLGTARPELLDRRASWGGGKANSITLSLSPLSEEETARLVDQLVDRTKLTPESEQALIAHAAGNALYAEQYVRMWEEHGHAGLLPPPETVQGIIAARLDALPWVEKSLLQNAAVVGKTFWKGAVVAVDGVECDAARHSLRVLERKEFIQRARRSSVEGEDEYGFRHVLVRDVVYGQIPRAARAEKHQRAAVWIETLGRAEDHAEMLAHHYTTAHELALASGVSVDELAARAHLALRRAGDRAASLNAYTAAADFYGRALALARGDEIQRAELLFGRAEALYRAGDERREQALEDAREALVAAGDRESAGVTEALLAAICRQRGQREAAVDHLQRSLELVADASASAAKARVLSYAAALPPNVSDSASLAEEAIGIAQAIGRQDIEAEALLRRGSARIMSGDRSGLDDVERGLVLAIEVDDRPIIARAYVMRSVFAPDIWRSLESSTAAEDVYVQLGDSTGARHVRGNRIFQLAQLGRWDEALEIADEFLAECDAGKAHFQESLVRGVRASIRLGRNDDAGAGADLGRAIALAREALDPEDLPTALGSAVRLYAELGRIDDAQDLGRQLLTANPRATRPSLDLALVAERIGLSEALVGLAGDVSTLPPIAYFIALRAILEGRIAEAAETLAGEGRLQGAADVRRYAANALLVEGRRDEAEAQAERALAFYRSVDATRFVRELEALLATMSAGAARS